ncbi:MAG: hypothetical protein LAP61_24815 [Acidobacteriia bacterium]|nr:hypothetical protein [Terriglobia bacterium]
MSLELIRYKAQKLESALRHQVMWSYVAALGIGAVSLYISWRFDQIFIRIGAGVLFLWAGTLAYQARKGAWPGRLAPGAAMTASLDFYRQELECQRFYVRARGKALWPVLLSTALFLTPAARAGWLIKFSPFLIVMAVWAVALIVTARRKLRAVQKELDELDGLRKKQ